MKSDNLKTHPWRACPTGKHLVKEHVTRVPPSKKHLNGIVSIWHEHCANNPSHKDELSYAELQFITKTYFSSLSGPPTAKILTKIFARADDYDVEIRGWVQYWNDIFKPTPLLDANLIKALIATESSFDPTPKRTIKAHGLMQIRNDTLRYLGDPKGELKDYLLPITQNELLDPSANICAGICWLFRKKETASSKLKREATWEEAVEEYKSFLDNIIHGEPYNSKPMDDLRNYYSLLNEASP